MNHARPPQLSRSATALPGRSERWGCRGPFRGPLLQNRLELELAADRGVRFHGLEARHGVVVDVTVLVEAPLAVDALEVLGGGDGLAHGLALLGDVLRLLDVRRGPLDGVDDDAASLARVEGARGRPLPVLRLVRVGAPGTDAPEPLVPP